MAALCASCGAKRNHSVHLRAVAGAGYHPWSDASRAGLKAVSSGRAAYQASQEHRDAMELSAGARDCWPAAYGAPGACLGEIGPSHSLSRGKAGGLEAADKYPSPPACSWHNAAMEQDPEVRAWGEAHFYAHNGRDWPFKISDSWLQAERDRVRI